MLGRILVSLILLLAGAACSQLPRGVDAGRGVLPSEVARLIAAGGMTDDALGAIAIRINDGKVLLSHNARKSLQPASTMKLLTSISGLERLGPAFRSRSELRAAGSIEGNALHGDLIFKGGADPDLDWLSFRGMLAAARDKGIVEIRGDFIVDRSYFNPPREDLGLPPFDETPEFRYNVVPDAAMVNTNLLQFDFQSDKSGLVIRTTPALDGVVVSSRLTLVDRACDKWEDGWNLPVTRRDEAGRIVVELSGDFPRNCRATTHLNVIERQDFIDRLFRTFWRELGGTIHGATREGTTPAATTLLADHRSRSLGEWVRDINKRSDNPWTRLLFLTQGARSGDPAQPTAARADAAIREWMAGHKIATDGLVLENGSGLSRLERIAPETLAQVLLAAWNSNWAPEFQNSLPIVAIDAAMASRLTRSPAARRARFKTGSLRNVSAIAGYGPDATGAMCVLVAILNHQRPSGSLNPVGRPVLDALIDWLAVSGGK